VEVGKPGFYSASLLFPRGTDLSVLKAGAADAAFGKWPKAGEMKLKSPFLDQGEQVQYGGFESGAEYLRAVAYEQRPRVFDTRMQPLTDETRVYAGVWAIAIIRFFTYDKGVNRGVSTGLNGLMIVADDKQLGGGGVDPQTAFGGVQIDAEVDPAGMFSGGEDKEAAARRALFGE